MSAVDELLAFVRRCVDEDERVASTLIALGGLAPGDPMQWQTQYLAVWDPKRALDEVEAKRRILDLHDRDHECSTYSTYEPGEVDNCSWVLKDDGGCSTIRLLAQPYAGREGWQEEWQS